MSFSCKPISSLIPVMRMCSFGKIHFLQLHVRSATFLQNERLASQHFPLKTKGKPWFFYKVSHQMFDSSSSPDSTVSQAESHQVTKGLSREGLDLPHFVLKALYKLLNTCNREKFQINTWHAFSVCCSRLHVGFILQRVRKRQMLHETFLSDVLAYPLDDKSPYLSFLCSLLPSEF